MPVHTCMFHKKLLKIFKKIQQKFIENLEEISITKFGIFKFKKNSKKFMEKDKLSAFCITVFLHICSDQHPC